MSRARRAPTRVDVDLSRVYRRHGYSQAWPARTGYAKRYVGAGHARDFRLAVAMNLWS
jgi:hypothetical protein